MRLTLKAVVILLFGILAGCATTKSISTEFRTEVYEQEYDTVFKAAVQTFSNQGFAVERASHETGVINTGFNSNSALAAAFVGNSRSKVNAVLSEVDSGTRVRLTITAQQQSIGGWTADNMPKDRAREMYREWFNKIQTRVDEMQ